MKIRTNPSRPVARTAETVLPNSAALLAAVLAALAASAPAQQQQQQHRLAALGPQLSGAAADTFALAVGDVDGDGDPDLACSRQSQVCLYLNDGRGAFSDVTATHVPVGGSFCTNMALADVDGDGDLDLLQATHGQDRLYLNDGSGTFTDVTATHAPPNHPYFLSQGLAVGDIDGDGDLDAVIGRMGYGYGLQNALWVNDGQGHFTNASSTQFPPDDDLVGSMTLGDVDGDGDLDLVSGNQRHSTWPYGSRGANTLYINDGSGTFANVSATRWGTPEITTNAAVVADFDADGDLDIVCANAGQDRAYHNDGRGFFTDVTASTMPIDNDWTAEAQAADMDGDGDLDVILAGGGGQQLRMLLNDGAGRFSEVPANQLPLDTSLTSGVILEDLDADGDPDLVLAHTWWNNESSDDRIYLNLLRQLHAPAPPTLGQPYRLDVYARHGQSSLFDVALPCVALAPALIPLPRIGTLGLDPNGLVRLQPVLISPVTGLGTATILIPNRPALAGTNLFGQALLVRYPLQDRLTNVTLGTLR